MIATGRAATLGSRSTISGWAAISLSPKCTARLTTECVAASIIQRPWDLTEFNAWYNTEHIPQITSLPGFINGRRYIALEEIPKYLALYELQEETITAGSAFQHVLANPTPWSARMRGFYKGYRIRTTYRLLFTAGEAPVQDAPYVFIGQGDVDVDFEREFNEWYE